MKTRLNRISSIMLAVAGGLLLLYSISGLAAGAGTVFVLSAGFFFLAILSCMFFQLTGTNRMPGFRRAGSLIFHAGLLAVIAGSCMSYGKRSHSRIVLTEGQSHVFENPGARIRLERFSTDYEKGLKPVQFSWIFSVFEENRPKRTEAGKVNDPVSLDGMSIVYSRHGFSPHLLLRDAGGGKIMDAFLNLGNESPEKRAYHDSFTLPGGKSLSVEFFPDFDAGALNSRGYIAADPAVILKLDKKNGSMAQCTMKEGETKNLGDLSATFDSHRYWAAFRTTSDAGEPFAFTGFLLAACGLFIVFTEKLRHDRN